MDPLSFTASLMTVSGVTIMTSKLVYRLHETVKNAPKDVGDLLEQLQTFQELLEELQTQLQDFTDNTAAQSKLLQMWGQSVAHMQRDVESLHTKLIKLEQLLKKKSLGSRILLSARQMLSEKKVAEYQRKIDTHCGVLTCIKATVCDQKLSKLTQNTIQLGSDNRAGFQTISSQVSQATGHLEAETRGGFSNVSSDLQTAKFASDEMHRALQSRLDIHAQRGDVVRQNVDEIRCKQMKAIEVNEAGFQGVQSALVTAASFSREGHESTHAMLREQRTLMQRLGNHLAFGASNNCVRAPLSDPDKWGSTAPTTTVYWKPFYYSLPIGYLRISLDHGHNSKGSEDSPASESTESSISVAFAPPKWLTCLAVDYRMKLVYNSIGDQWHWGANLRPLTVNQNPFVIDALDTVNLEGIQKSFREGLLHPTDYVLMRGTDLRPWYMVRAPYEGGFDKNPFKLPSLLVYMAENGLPGQHHLLYSIVSDPMPGLTLTLSEGDLENYIRTYLQHGGNLFTRGLFQEEALQYLLLYHRPGTVKFVSESFFHSSQSLTVDELSSLGICFLGSVARVNPEIRTRLKAYLASYRSPLLAAGTIYAETLLESTFGTASVLRHFHRLEAWHSRIFLAGLCRTGTPSMLRPFIDTGIDLNDKDDFCNMLSNAAAVGNIDIVSILLESGANGALALDPFFLYGIELSDGLFKHLLELLVESSRPTSFEDMSCDALYAVINSSRALSTHPKAPEVLIRRKVFSDELINCPCTLYHCSYMCVAIRNRLCSVVELLLQHGAYAKTMSSWLVFSVHCGAAPFTEALVEHGANVNFLDRAGRSALQLARSNVGAPHPRRIPHCRYTNIHIKITAEQDVETLAVVERAFRLKSQSSDDMTVHEPSSELEPQSYEKVEAIPASQNKFEKACRALLAYYQRPILGRHSRFRSGYEIRNLWALSFHEALLMRFFYVLSYVLLLVLGILAFIRGDKRVRMPSRTILSAVALLLLAYIWGTSPQTGLPSKPDAGRSFTKQDS